MLTEYGFPGEPDGQCTKRWFSDAYSDLYVWLESNGDVASFQLCYNKPVDEHALTWKRPSTYYHQRVDDGESHAGKNKSTPVLLPDGTVDLELIARRFLAESAGVETRIAQFVETKIRQFKKR